MAQPNQIAPPGAPTTLAGHAQNSIRHGAGLDLTPLVPIVVFTIVAWLNHTAVLNHFLRFGADSDTLWHTGLFWLGDFRLTNPPSIDNRSYFGTHFTPFLIVPGLVSRFLPFDAIAWYAIVIGTCHGVTAAVLAAAVIGLSRRLGHAPWIGTGAAMVGGIAMSLNAVAVQLIQTPHYEILVPGLVLATAMALALARYRLAVLAFVVLLSLKQDAGLHASLLLLTLVAGTWLTERRLLRPELGFAAAGIAYGIFGFAFAPMFLSYYQGHMVGYFIGNPPFAHWRLDEIATKVNFFAWQSGHVWAPLLASIVFAAVRRDLALALASIAVLPWFVATVCFTDYLTVWVLAFHYVFPALIAIGWPAVLGLYRSGPRRLAGSMRGLLAIQAIVLALAFLPKFGTHLDFYFSRYRYVRYDVARETRDIDAARAFLTTMRNHRAELGRLRANVPLISLAPHDFVRRDWIEGMTPQDVAIPTIDTIVFLEASMRCDTVNGLARATALPREYQVPGTRIVVRTRLSPEQMPSFMPHLTKAVQPRLRYCQLKELSDR